MNETQLHVDKAARRGELEAIITAGLSTVFKVGTALAEIRDATLYQPEFESFEAYCVARWDFKRAHAYRYIEAATLVTEMSPIGDITRESHARALLSVPAEQRAEVFRAALAKATSEVHLSPTMILPANLPASESQYLLDEILSGEVSLLYAGQPWATEPPAHARKVQTITLEPDFEQPRL
jgi:hypothetical protein